MNLQGNEPGNAVAAPALPRAATEPRPVVIAGTIAFAVALVIALEPVNVGYLQCLAIVIPTTFIGCASCAVTPISSRAATIWSIRSSRCVL